MYILIYHKIHKPGEFWERARSSVADLPAHIKLHSILPNQDGTTATCLWEAPSIKDVRDFVTHHVGELNEMELFEVDMDKAPNNIRPPAERADS
ncbi:MAG: hypothetical protein WD077_03355 [Bacteroidia bacterium]